MQAIRMRSSLVRCRKPTARSSSRSHRRLQHSTLDAIRETAGGVIVELLDADRIVFVGESLSAQDMTNAIYLV